MPWIWRDVNFDKLLNTLKVMSCKPHPAVDSIHCFGLCGFFFPDLNRNRLTFRKWFIIVSFWCFYGLSNIKSVPFFSPKHRWNGIPWSIFVKVEFLKCAGRSSSGVWNVMFMLMETAGLGNFISSYSTAKAFSSWLGETISETRRVGLVRYSCFFPWSHKLLSRAPLK